MAKDYYSVLARVTSALDPNTVDARRAIYDRARLAVMDAGLSAAETSEERAALEEAITRIETEAARPRPPPASLRRQAEGSPADPAATAATQGQQPGSAKATFSWPTMLALGTAAVLIVAAIVGYAIWPRASVTGSVSPTKEASAPVAKIEGATSGGGSADSSSYIFKRQLVYYRTIHPLGTIVIAKSQRFLYLVRPNVAAFRYTIGVGRECANLVGLLLVSAKEEWLEPRPQPITGEPQLAAGERPPSASPVAAGRAEGRFGARSLALGDTGHRIHGTKSPITTATGECFALANEDIIDLYDRVSAGTRVVIN
jgi:lipoprotein-anchoring transpeptidase ErfK/SrfK